MPSSKVCCSSLTYEKNNIVLCKEKRLLRKQCRDSEGQWFYFRPNLTCENATHAIHAATRKSIFCIASYEKRQSTLPYKDNELDRTRRVSHAPALTSSLRHWWRNNARQRNGKRQCVVCGWKRLQPVFVRHLHRHRWLPVSLRFRQQLHLVLRLLQRHSQDVNPFPLPGPVRHR